LKLANTGAVGAGTAPRILFACASGKRDPHNGLPFAFP